MLSSLQQYASGINSPTELHRVKQLCYWGINLKQRNRRKYTRRWCDQNLIIYSYQESSSCCLWVFLCQPHMQGPGNGRHSSELDLCTWMKVSAWQWKMWRWRQWENQLEHHAMPVNNSEMLQEGAVGRKKIQVYPLNLLENLQFSMTGISALLLLPSESFSLNRNTLSQWTWSHYVPYSHVILIRKWQLFPCSFLMCEHCTKTEPTVHPTADMELILSSALYIRQVCRKQKAEFKGLFLLHSSETVEKCLWDPIFSL